jgi:tyrosinase
MALDGKMFTIHIFLGDVSETLPPAPDYPNLVGQVFNFSAAVEINDSGAGCGNCIRQQADKTKTTGRIVLTNSLITRWKHKQDAIDGESGSLASMNPEDVIPYLKDNLDWRVTCMGQPVTNIRRDIPSLKISVAVGLADHHKDTTKMSKFYKYKGAYEVTQGRAGGAKPSDLLYPPQSIYR